MGEPVDAAEELERCLEPGETVLWRGRPAAGASLRIGDMIGGAVGVAAAYSLIYAFFFGAPLRGGGRLPPYSFFAGLAFLVVTLSMLLLLGVKRRSRAQTRYLLTDHRILTLFGGLRTVVESHDLRTIGEPTWESVGGGRGTIDYRRRILGLAFEYHADSDHGLLIGVNEPEKVHALLTQAREARRQAG